MTLSAASMPFDRCPMPGDASVTAGAERASVPIDPTLHAGELPGRRGACLQSRRRVTAPVESSRSAIAWSSHRKCTTRVLDLCVNRASREGKNENMTRITKLIEQVAAGAPVAPDELVSEAHTGPAQLVGSLFFDRTVVCGLSWLFTVAVRTSIEQNSRKRMGSIAGHALPLWSI
jgi:hypothetical protein